MPVYTIIRIYEVPAKDQKQAVERMGEALASRTEKDYHRSDYIKSPDMPKGKGVKISLVPPKGWKGAALDQLLGRK